MSGNWKLEQVGPAKWKIAPTGGMRVPGVIYADETMLSGIRGDPCLDQVANVACLPGIVGASLAMPDIHWGYGFPIGGVAAFDVGEGVVSPGGVGYDISCGVRLLRTKLHRGDLEGKLDELLDALFRDVPSGVGSEGKVRLDKKEVRRVFRGGARWAVERGYGSAEDLAVIEDGGALPQADENLPSERAVERGRAQVGTLGSGNHFLEIQVVDRIEDPGVAEAFGLAEGDVSVLIHTGSRGCGYQICDDFLKAMQSTPAKYGISLPDRQLSCAPFSSPEGRDYFAAMCAGANYARANRQMITHWTRESFERVLHRSPRDLGMEVVYDVAHNLAKVEEHVVDGEKVRLCVHRKGATRAFPAGHPEVPERYRAIGQPVLVPGSMGTASWVLVGTEQALRESWGTACHGAGRTMSRAKAARSVRPRALIDRLARQGIRVRAHGTRTLVEETPEAYKDVDRVVAVCAEAGLARKVARMRPIGVVKG